MLNYLSLSCIQWLYVQSNPFHTRILREVCGSGDLWSVRTRKRRATHCGSYPSTGEIYCMDKIYTPLSCILKVENMADIRNTVASHVADITWYKILPKLQALLGSKCMWFSSPNLTWTFISWRRIEEANPKHWQIFSIQFVFLYLRTCILLCRTRGFQVYGKWWGVTRWYPTFRKKVLPSSSSVLKQDAGNTFLRHVGSLPVAEGHMPGNCNPR